LPELNKHESVKMLLLRFRRTSKFEVSANKIVITKAANVLFMATSIPLKNIEEEQKADQATVEQISKIIRFLWNIED
jgi:hypothetical protein